MTAHRISTVVGLALPKISTLSALPQVLQKTGDKADNGGNQWKTSRGRPAGLGRRAADRVIQVQIHGGSISQAEQHVLAPVRMCWLGLWYLCLVDVCRSWLRVAAQEQLLHI